MRSAVMVAAIDTGIVVIVVAVAVVLVVRAGDRVSARPAAATRCPARRGPADDLDEAEGRVERAEHERDVALEGRDARDENR